LAPVKPPQNFITEANLDTQALPTAEGLGGDQSIEKSTEARPAVSKLNRPPPASRDFQVQRADTALFGTLPGLQMQAGVPIRLLPRLALKEAADNAADAADRAGRPGQVSIEPAGGYNRYLVTDQGDGIAGTPEELAALFAIGRPMISSKFWRLPSRGQLGNGLRILVGCIAATRGTLEITTRDRRTLLRPLATGRTEIVATDEVNHPVGTRLVIEFGYDAPHDDNAIFWGATTVAIAQRADAPYARRASPRWFDIDHFVEVLRDIEPADTTIRQFLEQLDGCSGAKAGQIAAPFGKNRTCRSLSAQEATDLLVAAQAAARVVKPESLCLIGPQVFDDYGYARQFGAFWYGVHDPKAEIPFAVEAWAATTSRKGTKADISIMANRSPITTEVAAHRAHDRKSIKLDGAGLSSSFDLASGDCDIILHITSPLIPISSIGKRPDLSIFGEEICEAIRLAFNKSRNRLPPNPEDPKPTPLKPAKPPSHKSVVLNWLSESIRETSEDGKYIFSQRNLFYRVRPYVERGTGGEELTYANFCSILTNHESEHGDITGMIRDARGSFRDLTAQIELGTTEVAAYERPPWQFHKVLFCEKEDHVRILRQANWPQKHDCALMSSKGYASRAARDLIDLIADTSDDEPVTVFCIHDADASGTMIVQTLQEATRARNRRRIEIIDIGLEPWQAIEMSLPIEDVAYDKVQPVADYVRDRPDGEHWFRWLQHHRVELNAMIPGQLISWLDQNVEEHGDLKVVPPPEYAAEMLLDQIQRLVREQETNRIMQEQQDAINEAVEDRLAEIEEIVPEDTDIVADLRMYVEANRRSHWSHVVRSAAEEFCTREGDHIRHLSPIRRRGEAS
jgi:DNA topoisomerase VI subunit B